MERYIMYELLIGNWLRLDRFIDIGQSLLAMINFAVCRDLSNFFWVGLVK